MSMKKTMILALSAIMMAAGSVSVNAQEKVVTLDQLLKSQQKKQEAAKPETKTQSETKAKAEKPAKKETAKTPKSSAAAAGLMAPVAFSTVYLQYNFESQKVKSGSHSDSESGNSVSAGYNYAFPISGTLPLYVEAGIAAKYVWQNKDGRKFNMFSAKVPVNLLFSYPVSESFSIEPYAGLYLRGNIFGKVKYDGHSGGGYSYDDGDIYLSGTTLYSRSALKKWGVDGRHVIRTYSYETTSQSQLCNRAVSNLKKVCDMQTNYGVTLFSAVEGIEVGDTVRILNPGADTYLEARVLVVDTRTDGQPSVTLGDYLIK